MITDPLTGARKPEQTDGPLGGLQIANAVNDLASFTVPRFANTADRDAKYAEFVAAGGTLEDGMLCWADAYYERQAGAWRLLGPVVIAGQGVAEGTSPSSNQQAIIKAFSRVVTTNANGDATISFPSTFPNGLASVVVTSGDLVAGNHAYAAVISSATNSINTRHFQPGGGLCVSVGVRVNVIAVGW